MRRHDTYCSNFSCTPVTLAVGLRPGVRRAIGLPSNRSRPVTEVSWTEVSWTDGTGTLGNKTTLRFKGEFGLTAIHNDLFSRPSLLWS
jgi:hypothetical protein